MLLFLEYPTCSTCRKAKKWLDEHGIEYTARHIVEDKPSLAELKSWKALSGLPVKKLFNTSGKLYKEHNLKAKLADMSEDEQLSLLADSGMLIKRPVLVSDTAALFGFKEDDWTKAIINR